MTAPAPTTDLRALGEYDILALIGRGGMADVYAARLRSQPDRLVALKVIRPELARDQGFVAMFLDEARIASRLSHPNVVSIYGLGHDAGRHYLVMELLRGRTLAEIGAAEIARGQRMPVAMAAWIGARVADALHHAHELRDEAGSHAQVVHRDVNPSNVFVCATGEPKVIDFGLAKARDRISATAIGVVKGKLAYLSPEQVAGKAIDRRSDLFSLGVTLWEVTVGRRLFREDSDVATVQRVLAADVPDPASLVADYPPALAATLRRALAADPMRRFARADELARALDAFVEDAGGCSVAAVARELAELFPPEAAPAWEARVFGRAPSEAAARHSAEGAGNVRVWDEGAQKMTWAAATAETVVGDATPREAAGAARSRPQEIDETLEARVASLAADPSALARTLLERSLARELFGDRAEAVVHAERALATFESAAAHAALRRLLHARGAEQALLAHQGAELEAEVGDAARADRWAERARLLRASGATEAAVQDAYTRALASAPDHAAALKGLEVELARAPAEGRDGPLAEHLARMADAYEGDARLAARLHVERAELLDASDTEAASAALERARSLDPAGGAVREACILHASRHRQWSRLADLLEAEAEREATPARAAALELEAARIRRLALGQEDRAIALLERASARAPASPRVDARVADELVAAYERAARRDDELGARRRRLTFVPAGPVRAAELRILAALEESSGDSAAAIADLREARDIDPSDGRATEALDRLLAAASLTPDRIALLVDEASRVADDDARVGLLLRAASLAQSSGDASRAVELARACLVAKPAHQAAVDLLARLLASVPTAERAGEARARIALHAHAAAHATDPARRVAHLEVAAIVSEELLGDAALAASTYEEILAVEPQRRSALLGLARAARRAGDPARQVRALLEEASVAFDAASADALRVEAAGVLASSDVAADRDRALALASAVLAREPEHAEARRIEQRIHEDAGRWGKVDRSLAARVAGARTDAEKVGLLEARAELLRTRLRDPVEALRALRDAHRLAPARDDLRRAILSLLEERGDARALRDGLVAIADEAGPGEASIDALTRAAEIDELVLADDASAAALLDRVLAVDPEDASLLERRDRLGARHTGTARTEPTLDAIQGALTVDPRDPRALRQLEAAARKEGSAPRLANALSAQGEAWTSTAARAGALWGLVELVEWTLPPSDPAPVLDALLALLPDDVAALDARVRCAIAAVARGESSRAHLDALRKRAASAVDPADRVLAQLAIGLALDPEGGADEASSREALGWYSAALAEDGGSIVAAYGAARLGVRFKDDAAYIAGTTALAEASSPKERAVRLTQAAGKLMASNDPRLGAPASRAERAFDWLEAALDADPDSVPAAGLLVGARAEETRRDRLIAVLRRALERAKGVEAKVRHGTELARIARLEPADRVLAIEALRAVVAAQPTQAAAWRSLADVALEQGAPAEATAALESLVTHTRDPRARLAALFDLAELYRARPDGAVDVERVLRAALDTDPTSERAVRGLLAARRAQAPSEEVTALLARLADAVHGADARATVLGELGEAQIAAGQAAAAEKSLVEALATAPNAARLGRVLDLHATSPSEQARVLGAAVARGEGLGRADPATLVRLGRLLVEALGRPAEGVPHLRRAIALSPTMHDARAVLARGLVDAGAPGEATATIASMMVPEAAPLLSLPEPAAALATLERAFASEGKADEAAVARELRVVAGGLDDAAHVELRARRLPLGTLDNCAGAFDRATLVSAVAPAEIASLALALAHAFDGVEAKLARTEPTALELAPRASAGADEDDPLRSTHAAIARALGIEVPPFAVSAAVTAPRVALLDGEAWVIAPAALASRPVPDQITGLARAVVRVALGVPWIDELAGPDAHALLLAAARRVVRDYASELEGPDLGDRVEEMARHVARAVGPLAFKQRKALGDLAGRLSSEPTLDARAAHAFTLAVARTELRVAFVLSGDLLATLDALRASDAAFARETGGVGPRALAAVLGDPLSADVVRFALSRQATALRRRLGTIGVHAR